MFSAVLMFDVMKEDTGNKKRVTCSVSLCSSKVIFSFYETIKRSYCIHGMFVDIRKPK